jgi:RHS repeat-associated protein
MTQAGTSFYSRQTYFPYGASRTTEGSALPTDNTFTGQKSDDSTGLMFYGARYYDTTLGRFTQPDTIVPNPLNPQSLNRFAYVLNNPLKYTDPTGHVECWDEDCNGGPSGGGGGGDNGGGSSGNVNPCNADPTAEGCPGAQEAVPSAETGENQYPNGKECWPHCNDEGEGDGATPWDVGWEWLSGQGPRHHTFRDGDPFTELLQTHYWIDETRDEIAACLAAGGSTSECSGNNNYDLGGLEGVPKYFQDYSNVLTLGHTGNLAVTFLGSYELKYQMLNVDKDAGTAKVLFHVSNESTLASATHPPVLGYLEFWEKNITPTVNALVQTGPMSKVTQDFYWAETITFR